MRKSSVSKITSRNYKNIRLEEGLELGSLNIFIGANESGKSNVISLFKFLQVSVAGSGTDDQRGRTSFENAVDGLGGAMYPAGWMRAGNWAIYTESAIPQSVGGRGSLGLCWRRRIRSERFDSISQKDKF